MQQNPFAAKCCFYGMQQQITIAAKCWFYGMQQQNAISAKCWFYGMQQQNAIAAKFLFYAMQQQNPFAAKCYFYAMQPQKRSNCSKRLLLYNAISKSDCSNIYMYKAMQQHLHKATSADRKEYNVVTFHSRLLVSVAISWTFSRWPYRVMLYMSNHFATPPCGVNKCGASCSLHSRHTHM